MNIKHGIMAVAAAVLLAAPAPQETHARATRQSADVSGVTRRADAGDSDALNQLGVWHYSGQHVAKDVDKAVGLWRRAARQGNPKAIANLGICYQYGTGVRRDSLTAMRLYASAIDAGQLSLLSQRRANVGKTPFDGMLVGLCYEKGIGVDADAAIAADAYRSTADMGSSDAAVAAARCLLAAGDAVGAYRYAQKAAEAGNPDGMAMAGIMLADGKGVAPSTEKAAAYLLKAAPHNIDAVNRLATMMFAGTPEVSSDSHRITSMLVEAARKGNSQAMLNYARALRDGTGVNRDYDRALHWLSLVAETGDETSVNRFMSLSPDTFRNYARACALVEEGEYDEADKILKGLERKKITEASVMRAAILASPDNPDANSAAGIRQLRKLSGKSNQAATLLAGIYRNNIQRDDRAMVSLLQRAADKGYGPAAAMLADIYRTGDGVRPDAALADSYAQKAFVERDIYIR